jgi:hypothetical protein
MIISGNFSCNQYLSTYLKLVVCVDEIEPVTAYINLINLTKVNHMSIIIELEVEWDSCLRISRFLINDVLVFNHLCFGCLYFLKLYYWNLQLFFTIYGIFFSCVYVYTPSSIEFLNISVLHLNCQLWKEQLTIAISVYLSFSFQIIAHLHLSWW